MELSRIFLNYNKNYFPLFQLQAEQYCKNTAHLWNISILCCAQNCRCCIRGGVWGWQVGRPPQAPLLKGPHASGLWVCQAIFSGKLEMLIHAPFKNPSSRSNSVVLYLDVFCTVIASMWPQKRRQSPGHNPLSGLQCSLTKSVRQVAKVDLV